VENNYDPNDAIQRALNESKRQQLKDEFGMPEGYRKSDIDPELEGQFLDYMLEWERAYASAEETTVKAFIGDPEIIHRDDLSVDEMNAEIDRILEIMAENRVFLECSTSIDVKELYDFLLLEFMQHECLDMRVTDTNVRYSYEELRPEFYEFDDEKGYVRIPGTEPTYPDDDSNLSDLTGNVGLN
jgi:hypothetical protein